MNADFSQWLQQNGLQEVFTTSVGDRFYVNTEKKFGVLKKQGEYGAYSFYLDDIVSFETYDDEILVEEWNRAGIWRAPERATHHSTCEVNLILGLKTGQKFKIRLFRAMGENVKRNSREHADLHYYARRIGYAIYTYATK